MKKKTTAEIIKINNVQLVIFDFIFIVRKREKEIKSPKNPMAKNPKAIITPNPNPNLDR